MYRSIAHAMMAGLFLSGCHSAARQHDVARYEVNDPIAVAEEATADAGDEEPSEPYTAGSVAETSTLVNPDEIVPGYKHDPKSQWIKGSWAKRHPVLADGAIVGARTGLEISKFGLNVVSGLGQLPPMGGGTINPTRQIPPNPGGGAK